MSENLTRWVGFRIVLGLVPIAANALRLLFSGQAGLIDAEHLVGHGELLLLVSAVRAGAIGELISAPKRFPELRIAAGCVCVVVMIISAIGFAFVAEKIGTSTKYQANVVATSSLVIYIVGLVASFVSVVIAEYGKKNGAVKPPASLTDDDVVLLREIRDSLKGVPKGSITQVPPPPSAAT